MDVLKNANNICRLCATGDYLLYGKNNLKDIVLATIGIQISENDLICQHCFNETLRLYEFRQNVLKQNRFRKEKRSELTNTIESLDTIIINKTTTNPSIESNNNMGPKNVHPSIKKLQVNYPSLKLPQEFLQSNIAPIVSLNNDEVQQYFRTKNRTSTKIKVPNNVRPKKVAKKKTVELVNKRKSETFSRPRLNKTLMSKNVEFTAVTRLTNEALQEMHVDNTSEEMKIMQNVLNSNEETNYGTNFDTIESTSSASSVLMTAKTRKLMICKLCSGVCLNLPEFKRHIANHKICQFCHRKFRSIENKQKHVDYLCHVKNGVINLPKKRKNARAKTVAKPDLTLSSIEDVKPIRNDNANVDVTIKTFNKHAIKPDIRIKDSTVLDDIEPHIQADQIVLKKILLSGFKYQKLTVDKSNQTDLPTNKDLKVKFDETCEFKNLNSHLETCRASVLLSNGPFQAAYFPKITTKNQRKKMDLWTNLPMVDINQSSGMLIEQTGLVQPQKLPNISFVNNIPASNPAIFQPILPKLDTSQLRASTTGYQSGYVSTISPTIQNTVAITQTCSHASQSRPMTALTMTVSSGSIAMGNKNTLKRLDTNFIQTNNNNNKVYKNLTLPNTPVKAVQVCLDRLSSVPLNKPVTVTNALNSKSSRTILPSVPVTGICSNHNMTDKPKIRVKNIWELR